MQNGSEPAGLYDLNAVCPYFTMFPLDFPLTVLRELGAPRKRYGVVADPFCGRGTTNLAASYFGLSTFGVDASPVAVALTKAKLSASRVDDRQVLGEAKRLIYEWSGASVPRGHFWSRLFDRDVLRQLCALRSGLMHERDSHVRSVLRGIALGALHGPLRVDGSSSYFSNQCPRTYSPKPRYALQFWRHHALHPPRIDILKIIEARANRTLAWRGRKSEYRVQFGDSRRVHWMAAANKLGPIRWIITSPPYYGLRTYRPDQWLREWFVGGSPAVTYSTDRQLRHSSPEDFTSDLSKVWSRLAEGASDDASLVFRFGGINDRPVSPREIARNSVKNTPWRIRSIRSAGIASHGKRQAESFSANTNPAIAEIDVWCVRA